MFFSLLSPKATTHFWQQGPSFCAAFLSLRPMRALLALLGAAPALADLPVHCLYSQIAGEWTFHLGAVRQREDV